MEYVNCPICGQNNTEIIYKKASLNKDVLNVICKNCALVFINPRPTKAEFDDFHISHFLSDKNKTKAEDVLPKLKTSDLAIKKTVAAFLDEFLLPGKNVLDVGCGFGALLDILKKEKNANVMGLELGNLDVEVARNYFHLPVFHGSLEKFFKDNNNHGKFDLIIMHHVLEHLPYPLESLEQIKKMLRPEGILYIAVPNILNIKKRPEEFFQSFHPFSFSPYSLKLLLSAAGFGVIKFNTEAGLPGGMEIAVKIDAININDEKLSAGNNYSKVIDYVKKKEAQFAGLRHARDKFLCFLPKSARIKIGRIIYKLMKKI